MNKTKQRRNDRDTAILLIPVIAIIGKLIQTYILPEKYFYDSNRMISMMTGSESMDYWVGYEKTVEIFKSVNYLNLTTVTSWSITLGIIGTILLMILISKCKEMSRSEGIFTMMAVGLLNIYVFSLAKEPVQFVFFLFAAIIIMLPINILPLKVAGCAAIFYWESNTFRPYYIMMAAMCCFLFVVFYLFKRVIKKITVMKIIIAAISCFLAMFLFMYLSQFIDYESYQEALTIRETVTNENAVTAMTNFFEGSENFNIFMLNYVINAFRMMIPVELLFKSPVYAPFVIYQIFILMYWIRTIKNIKVINNRALLSLICFTAYIFGSFVFEPDFGSWVRHEAASFPVFFIMAYEDLSIDKDKSEVN